MKPGHADLLDIVSASRTGLGASTVRGLLFLVSTVYRVAIGIRNWSFDCGLSRMHSVDAPVISIGNLTVGGTGKTPLVIWLAGRLRTHDDVAVVSRGYGSSGEGLNDEGLELQQRLPGIVQVQHRDRVAAAQQALIRIAAHRDSRRPRPVIILDDGFQHRRLARDLDIVVIDAVNPFGYGRLLPRGLLREPVSAIKRADIAVLSRANLIPEAERRRIQSRLLEHHPTITWVESELTAAGWIDLNRQVFPVEWLRAKRLLAFCGIGNPDGFRRTLEELQLTVADLLVFPDHCNFPPAEIQNVFRRAQQAQCEAIVCTGKDLVKIKAPPDVLPLVALQTEVRISEGAALLDRALGKLLPELEDAG